MKPIHAGVLVTLATACSGSQSGPIEANSLPDVSTEQRSHDPTAPSEEHPGHESTGSHKDEIDILEAVYRYQFENNPITMDGESLDHVDCLFVALGQGGDWTDPPPKLMERFADHTPPVEPVSASRYDGWNFVTHESRGGNGRIFSIERIRRIDADTVAVDGEYVGGCDTENTYRVKRREGSWVVESDAMWSIR